jgi:diguanylate cyclase (GGDEF)-like protein
MRLDVTDIKPGNEIESLAGSISMMVDDMRQFMRDNLAATQRVADVEHEMQDMSRIVYLDALTGAKSKAAYDQHAGRLNRQIAEGTAEFAILMVDLNNLKGINDSYGHEYGDVFIKGSSKLILMVFAHSPVYRVGGDEFVVVLEDIDYEWREQLMQDLENRFEKSQDPKRESWERFSAAFGLAVYDSAVDPYLDSVYNRADQLMYEDKRAKGGRGR